MLALVDKAKLDTKWSWKHGRHTVAPTGNTIILQTAKLSAAETELTQLKMRYESVANWEQAVRCGAGQGGGEKSQLLCILCNGCTVQRRKKGRKRGLFD